MKITRISPFSGKTNTMDCNVTAEEIQAWEQGELIQNAMPNTLPEEREFIKTGITPQEWDETFRPETRSKPRFKNDKTKTLH